MTFDTAERANEATEREEYSALQDDDEEREMVEWQIIDEYLADAWLGVDDDWVFCDQNRTNAALTKILSVIRKPDADPREQIDAVRSIICGMQSAAAAEHVKHLSATGKL